MSKKVKPLLVLKLNMLADTATLTGFTETAKQAFSDGCLIIDNRVEMIAFDDRGKMVYPIQDKK